MKRFSRTTTVHSYRLANKLNKTRMRNLAKKGDADTKVLSWDPISNNSVLCFGDFNKDKFGIDASGCIVPVESNVSAVIEHNAESENIRLNARRLDDTIVYSVDGKGNSLKTEESVEIEAGDIPKDLLPDETVVVNVRTADGDSDAYAAIHPTGEVVMHAQVGVPLAEDVPATAVAIKMDADVVEQTFESQHLKIRCRLKDQVIIQYAVEGKRQKEDIEPSPEGGYIELDAGTLGVAFTPLATGPIIALRTDGDYAGAYVEMNKDGSVALTIPVKTNFRNEEDKTTCTYLNVVREGTIEQVISATGYGAITIRRENSTFIYSIRTEAGSIAASANVNILAAGAIDKEMRPDEVVEMEFQPKTGTYGAFLLFNPDGSVTLRNATATAITTVDDGTVTHAHIKKTSDLEDLDFQTLENAYVEMEMKKDGNNIVIEAKPKDFTATAGTKTIFPDGTVDYAFCPEKEELITIPLSTGGHTSEDAYLALNENGGVDLVSVSGVAVDKVTNSESYIDLDETQGVIADHQVTGDCIELNARKQGDVIIYTVVPLVATFTSEHEEFKRYTLPEEMRPDSKVYMELAVDSVAATVDPAYVVIRPDGGVDVTVGDNLAVDIETVTETMKGSDTSVTSSSKKGDNLQVTAKKSDDYIVYEFRALKTNVAEGVTNEITASDPIPAEFRPQADVVCDIASNGTMVANSFAVLKTDGTVSLTADGNALKDDGIRCEIESIAENVYVEEAEYTATADAQGKPYKGVGAAVDMLKFNFKKYGDIVHCGVSGLGRAYTADYHKVLNAGTIAPMFCPAKGENIVTELLTKDNSAKPWLLGRTGIMDIRHDGSAWLRTAGAPIAENKNNTSYVDTLSEDLLEEELDLTDKLSSTSALGAEGVGDWLKATFRKVKNSVMGFLSGKGTISTSFQLGATDVNAEFHPDQGFRAEINSGGSLGKGSIEFGGDGVIKVGVLGSSLQLDGKKIFNLPFLKLGNGDIFQETVTTGMRGELREHHLHGEGHMYYYDHHISDHGVKSVICRHTYREFVEVEGFFGNLFSQAASFVKSNVDIKGIGSKLMQGAGTLVTGLMAGKGLSAAVKGTAKQFTSGGLSSFLRPDGPIASAIGTVSSSSGGKGLLGGVMKMLPNGASNIINKGADFLGSKLPFASSWINSAKSKLFGEHDGEMLLAPRNSQVIELSDFRLSAVRHGMNVTYQVASMAGNIASGETLKESLRPDAPSIFNLSSGLELMIDLEGKVDVIIRDDETEIVHEAVYVASTVKEYRPYGWDFDKKEYNFCKEKREIKTKRVYKKGK